MNMKRLVSLLLAFAMVFVMVIPPSQVHAKGDDEFVEADYKVENVDGKSYKVYKFTDLVGTSESNGQFEVDGLEVSEPRMLHPVGGSNPALGEEIPNADSYAVDVKWTTYDLAPENLGTPVYFQIVDDTTDKVIAQTENVNGKEKSKKYKFYKLPAWDDSGVSHNPVDWLLQAPNEYKFDVRLRTSTQGSGEDSNFQALISQRGMPIYRAEYYTNKAIPKIKVQRTNKADDTDEVSINTENLTGDQYYSWARAISDQQKPYFEGRLLDIQKYGQDTLMSLQISDNITAGRVKMAMKAPGKTKFDRGPGTFTDNGTPYHYEVTGDYLHIHIFTIRQDLKVKFDANGGTWKNTAPADQTIGHSMKLADSWAGLGPINVPGAGDLTPPTVAAGKPEKEFIGWNTDANASTALFTDNTYVTPITKDETFYAIYVEKPQGKVQVKYLDDSNAEIQAKYKYISDKAGEDEIKEGTTTKKLNLDEKYPSEKPGNKGETIKQELLNTSAAPTFIGYKIKQVKTNPVPNPPETAKYTETGEYTIQYIYEKLDPIIPAKDDNGNDNPKATEDVKATYIPVTIKVDSVKGKFKKNDADANGSMFKYYVNPVEDKKFADVLTASGLSAESNNANVYKIDTTKPWTFDPAKVKANEQETDPSVVVIKDTEINKLHFTVEKGLVAEVNFVKTKADQLKDKLDPVDIKVWVNDQDTDGSKITWKNGVKLNNANKDNETLKDLLAGATVTDLGENGTLAQEGTKRNSSKQNLPDGKTGTLKVAFDDGSALAVENQKLYVAPHKNVVKPNEPNQINPDKLPDDKVEVQFKLGEGVKIGDKNGEKTNPVLYETFYVKPGTSLEDNDIPTTSLVDGYKDNKWYKGLGANAPEATNNDYKGIQAQQNNEPLVFVAKAKVKGQGKATLKFVDDKGTELNPLEANSPLYIESEKTKYSKVLTGKDGTDINFTRADAPKIRGYELVEDAQNPITKSADKFSETTDVVITLKYKKLDDIIKPNNPSETIPAGYVAVKFLADEEGRATARGNFGTDGDTVVYFVNPKTVTIDQVTQKLAGNDKNGTAMEKPFPTLTVTDSDFVANKQNAQGNYDASGTQQWLVEGNTLTNNKLANTNTGITLTAKYLGKFDVKYVIEVKPAGKELPDALKELTVDYNDGVKNKTGLEPGAEYDTPTDLNLSNVSEEAKKLIGSEVGKWSTTGKWVKDIDNSGNVKFTLTWTFNEAGKPYEYLTLTLDENYRGGRVSDYDVYQYDLIERYLYVPHRRGYVFEGWSYNSRRLDEVRPGDRIEYSTTLYAIWSKQKPKDDEEVEPIDTREVGEHKAYMFGYTDGTVRPNGYITRAEAAALVTRLLGLDTFASAAEPAFTDTPSSWYNKAINAAVNRGIMKGYPDKSFRPNAPITRAEFTQMISTIDNKPYGVAPFADVVGHWAERPIGSEYQAGRIKGYPDGTFRPNAFITRAEAVVILNKIFERNYDAMSAINAKNKESIKRFIDLAPSFWGFNDMVEATNTHLFKRRVKGSVQEDWVEVK